MTLVKPIVRRRRGERAFIPSWLSDRDGVAPCICGRPLFPNEPHIMVTGEHDMRRWLHASCYAMMEDDEDDEEDWDDE